MKAAFQDSASAFPSSQLITLTKEFTDTCKFDKTKHGNPLPFIRLICIVREPNPGVYLRAASDVQMLPYADEKGHEYNQSCQVLPDPPVWMPYAHLHVTLTERSGVRLNIPLHM